MNSRKVKKTNVKESRQKEFNEILSLYDFIAPRKELKELYEQGVNEFVNGKTVKLDKMAIGPVLSELMNRAPALVQDVISLAADAADDEERAIIARLPVSSQLAALGGVFTLTLSTDGELGNGLETITQMLSGLNEAMAEKLQGIASR